MPTRPGCLHGDPEEENCSDGKLGPVRITFTFCTKAFKTWQAEFMVDFEELGGTWQSSKSFYLL